MSRGFSNLVKFIDAAAELAVAFERARSERQQANARSAERDATPEAAPRRSFADVRAAKRMRMAAAATARSDPQTGFERRARVLRSFLIPTVDRYCKEIERDLAKDLAVAAPNKALHRVRQGREVAVLDPEREPLVDPEAANAFVTEASAATEACRVRILPRLDNVVDKAFAEYTGKIGAIPVDVLTDELRRELDEKVGQVRTKWVDRLDARPGASDELLAELAALRRLIECYRTDPPFPPGADRDTILGRFRHGTPLSPEDLTRVLDAVSGGGDGPLAELTGDSWPQVQERAAAWSQCGVGSADAALIAEAFEASTVWNTLFWRYHGARPAITAVKPLIDRARELLKHVPEAPFAVDAASTSRIVRAMVLASESHNGRFAPAFIRHRSANIDYRAWLAPGTAAREQAFELQWIDRLEASACATIGLDDSKETTKSFGHWHVALLIGLRDALGVDEPSEALARWQAFLERRTEARASLIGRVAPFWAVLFEELLDSPVVSGRNEAHGLKQALLPFASLDFTARAAILADLEAVLEEKSRDELALASLCPINESTRTTVSLQFVGNGKMRVLRHLADVLKSSPEQQKLAFTPYPNLPDLGPFTELLDGGDERHGSPIFRDVRKMLIDGHFLDADGVVRQFLEFAPPSELRSVLLATRLENLAIRDWRLAERFIADPEIAAIGLDFSGHVTCNVARLDDGVPFEAGCFSRSVFPEGTASDTLRRAAEKQFWQGQFEDVDIGMPIEGLAPVVLALRAHGRAAQPDWPPAMRHFHETVAALARNTCYLLVNQVVARELETRRFTRPMTFIVGDHDFGAFPSVPHQARSGR